MPDRSTPTLRDMVIAARRDKRLTLRQLAKRAVDPETGQTASFSMFHDIEHGNINRAPSVAHLRAIAVALDKPFEVVRQAAIVEYLPATIDTAALLERASRLAAESDRLSREAARLAEIAGRPTSTGENGHRESA